MSSGTINHAIKINKDNLAMRRKSSLFNSYDPKINVSSKGFEFKDMSPEEIEASKARIRKQMNKDRIKDFIFFFFGLILLSGLVFLFDWLLR